ncbi:methionine synthase, partial [Nocardia salmonicida]
LNTVRALPGPEAIHFLDVVINALPGPVIVHTCAARPALPTLRRTAATALSFDAATITTADFDDIGEAVDSGKKLALGLVPTEPPTSPLAWRTVAEPAVRLVDDLGFPRSALTQVLVTPTCGLAGAPLAWSRKALALAADVARAFAEDPESLTVERPEQARSGRNHR